MHTLGIDPGITGALACWSGVQIKCVHDVPVLKYRVGKSVKKRLDLAAFHDLVTALHATFEFDLAVIEDVGGLPKQSAPNAFTFGFTAGAMTMALVAAGVPFQKVDPAKWKKVMCVSSDKNRARQTASELMPSARHLWTRSQDDGRAEAALLALYGHRLLRSSNGDSPLPLPSCRSALAG